MKESFYDWCINNDRQDLLDLWDYELNNKDPKEVPTQQHNTSYYFKCQNGIHDSEMYLVSSLTRHNSKISCSICNSFGTWCEKNNRKDLLKRWDYELNKVSPYEVSFSGKEKRYFKCPKMIHKSELKYLPDVTRSYGSSECIACNSIGQYGIDNIDKDFIQKYWSNKNMEDPFKIHKYSRKKIFIKCQKCDWHGDFEVTASNYVAGHNCPYCVGQRVSKLDSLGMQYPKTLGLWSNINKDTPYDYLPKSNKYVWWKCENGMHNDFRRRIYKSTIFDFRCPKCTKLRKESLLEEKVRLYLESLRFTIKHERDCSLIVINPDTDCQLLYDNEVTELKLLIEVNGMQHYKPISFFYQGDEQERQKKFEYRQYLDKYKQDYAIDHGYNFLTIPYWTDDKKETWKKLIDKKIASIVNDNNILA